MCQYRLDHPRIKSSNAGSLTLGKACEMNNTKDNQYIQLEIRTSVLTELINSKMVVAADLHALNRDSREGVRALLLNSLKSVINP